MPLKTLVKKKLLANGRFGNEIPNLTTFTLNIYQLVGYYCMPLLLKIVFIFKKFTIQIVY